MSLPLPTTAELALFMNVAEADLTDDYVTGYVAMSIQQAADLLEVATDLHDLSELAGTDYYDLDVRVVSYAIRAMAEALLYGTPWRLAKASPFSSETIGSYSYSTVLRSIASGQATGVDWFDVAVRRFRAGAVAVFSGTEIFENDMVWITDDGHRRVMGPAEWAYLEENWDPGVRG